MGKDNTTHTALPSSKEKIRFSELRYRRLFETAQDGILILDAHSGKIVDANPFLKKILGYSQEELLGKELWQIGVFKDIVNSKEAFIELQHKGYIRYKDMPLQTKDGRKIDVEFVSNTYLVGTEKVIQCNIRNIGDRKSAEEMARVKTKDLEKLNESQEKTKKALLNVMEDLETAKAIIEQEKAKDEAVLASIIDGLVTVDNDRRITFVNKAAAEMLGWSSKELIGKIITDLNLENELGDLIPFEKRPTVLALASGETTRVTYFFVRKNKTRFPIVITVTPIKLKGKTVGLIETIRDVTHEHEVDRAKSEFVSLASHQLRTPLGIVKWYLEALESEEYLQKAPEVVRGYFDEIRKSNERVLSLVRDLLSVSRIDQGRVQNIPKLVDLIQVINEIVSQMQIMAHKRGVVLHAAVRVNKIPPIQIDVLRFHEVIENLISNALEYTKPKGSVEVIVDEISETLSISVKDTGIGISPSDQKKLFTKFFRSERAVAQNSEGSGLGLYVVKSYVEGWSGKISVESVEGKGSTFTITLPLVMQNKKNILST